MVAGIEEIIGVHGHGFWRVKNLYGTIIDLQTLLDLDFDIILGTC